MKLLIVAYDGEDPEAKARGMAARQVHLNYKWGLDSERVDASPTI